MLANVLWSPFFIYFKMEGCRNETKLPRSGSAFLRGDTVRRPGGSLLISEYLSHGAVSVSPCPSGNEHHRSIDGVVLLFPQQAQLPRGHVLYGAVSPGMIASGDLLTQCSA